MTFHFKALGEKSTSKPKASRRKGMIKIRAEINEKAIKNQKEIEKINKPKAF